MSRTKLLAWILVLAASLYSCSGKDGATGPRGNDGNANVVIFEYPTRTTTTGTFNYLFNASQGLVDSSLVLGYYNPSSEASTAWYPVPGLGSGGAYMTRSFWWRTTADPSQYTYTVRLLTPSGSTTYTNSTTFTKFKIILVPASEIIPLTARGILDLSDYDAVREHLGLSE